MSNPLEKTTLRLNVACSSRDKKFLIVGEKDSTISDFLTAVQKTFMKLYPQEAAFDAAAVQNHAGFDVLTDYKLGDVFEDHACVNIIESCLQNRKAVGDLSSSGFVEEQNEKSDKTDLKVAIQDLCDNETTSLKQDDPSNKKLQDSANDKQQDSTNKKNGAKNERREKCLSSPENKRPHSDSDADLGDKRRKKHKNAKRRRAVK